MKRTGLFAIALAGSLAVACNGNARTDRNAETAPADRTAVGTSGTADQNRVTDGDKDFVHDVATANMAEIELGTLAQQRGQSVEVKRFGQMMVDDHTKAGNEMKQVASRFSIPLPTALDEKHTDLKNKLAKLQGRDFDRQFMDAMVDGHQDVADKLETRVDGHGVLGRDKDTAPVAEKSDNAATMALNQWAAATLPTVRHHLDQAKQLKDRVENHRNSTH